MRTARKVAVVFTACIIGLGLATPSWAADPKPSPGSTDQTTITYHGGTTNQVDKSASSDSVVRPAVYLSCSGHPTPYPVYSGSNNTLHYGGFIQCNMPASLDFQITLYEIVGNGDNQYYSQQNFANAPPQVTSTRSDSWSSACLGNASTRWITKMVGHVNGDTMSPGAAWSPVTTAPCE